MLKESKKILSLSLAAALSAVVFVTTGFAASSNVSGYEKVKESFFVLSDMENYTNHMAVSIQEDGVEILRGVMDGKVKEKLNHSMDMALTVDGESYTVSTYTTPLQIYTKAMDSEVYIKTLNYMSRKGNGIEITDNQKQLISIVLDMFAGDTKNYFTNNDGRITMKLEKGQIPEIFQVGLSVLSESVREEFNKNAAFFAPLEGDDPASAFVMNRLLNNINDLEIDSVYAEGTIDGNNVLTDANLTFTLTGADADGNSHITTFSVSNVITDIGTTELAPFDETDKKIIYPNTTEPFVMQSIIIQMEEDGSFTTGNFSDIDDFAPEAKNGSFFDIFWD